MSAKRNYIIREKMELKRWFIIGSYICLVLFLPFTVEAATVYTWDLQSDGNWSVAGNWNPTHVPNGIGDQARIDGDSAHDVTVYLDMPASVSGLELNISDKLSINNGVSLSLIPDESDNDPIVLNNGEIIVASTGGITRLQSVGCITTLTGNGSVVLSGYPSNQLNASTGFSFINDINHTIRGGGTVYAALTNNGEIVADNQILQISGHIDNTNGVMSASGSGNILRIADGSHRITVTGGQIIPDDGKIELNGATLALATLGSGKTNIIGGGTLSGETVLEGGAMLSINNGQILNLSDSANITNNGMILVNSSGGNTRLVALGSTATLTGNGSVVLNGHLSNQLSASTGFSFINDINHTIKGGGTVWAAVVNNGHIIADNQKLLFNSGISGNGSISVVAGAILDLRQNSETGNFYLREQADLLVANNLTVDLNGNFAFAQTDVSKWGWGSNCTLRMSGEGESMQPLEIGGEDLGAVPGGFSNNFNLENLSLEASGTYVYLSDSIANSASLSDEALYVSNLVVNPGTTLNLNGLNLYTVIASEIHLVEADDDDLFGGGTIIDNSAVISMRDIEFEPSVPISFDFGVVGIGEESTVEQVRLKNDGDGYIIISSVILEGDGDFDFDESCCMSTILGTDEECVLNIRFLPNAVGNRSATLTIQHNDPDEPEIVVSLFGIGVCRGDFDDDGDIDGLDLAKLAFDPGLLRLSIFGANLGRSDCDQI
ncbi:MAG: hypothetical protein SVW57_04380 [Thermodesulfobacteriota bacterium]|nr:hypothetical protein [Thermodesulfobacteriota bacterium]